MTTTSGALELSKVLLDNVGGLNVGTLKYTSRNIASSQLIDTKSRVFYNEIGKLIAAINKSPKFEWSVFTRYTDAVGPLERYDAVNLSGYEFDLFVTRLLLRLLTVTFSPIEGYTPPDNSTATAVTFINRWEADKVELLAALEDLHLSAFEVCPIPENANKFSIIRLAGPFSEPLDTLGRCQGSQYRRSRCFDRT
jgi:hypothetical protein